MSELWSPSMPGLDCISRGHILVENEEPGAWPVYPGDPNQTPWASWCLWCGSGISNELLPEEPG